MRVSLLIGAVAAVAAGGGCATSGPARLEKSSDVGSAVQQPFRDLNLVRDEIPDILSQAMASPYLLSQPVTCEGLDREIAALDEVLGPDVDAPGGADGAEGEALAAGLVRGVIGLPFGGIVRNLTGAAARDRQVRRAIIAGVARRSYLKGVAANIGCPLATPKVPDPPP